MRERERERETQQRSCKREIDAGDDLAGDGGGRDHAQPSPLAGSEIEESRGADLASRSKRNARRTFYRLFIQSETRTRYLARYRCRVVKYSAQDVPAGSFQ